MSDAAVRVCSELIKRFQDLLMLVSDGPGDCLATHSHKHEGFLLDCQLHVLQLLFENQFLLLKILTDAISQHFFDRVWVAAEFFENVIRDHAAFTSCCKLLDFLATKAESSHAGTFATTTEATKRWTAAHTGSLASRFLGSSRTTHLLLSGLLVCHYLCPDRCCLWHPARLYSSYLSQTTAALFLGQHDWCLLFG